MAKIGNIRKALIRHLSGGKDSDSKDKQSVAMDKSNSNASHADVTDIDQGQGNACKQIYGKKSDENVESNVQIDANHKVDNEIGCARCKSDWNEVKFSGKSVECCVCQLFFCLNCADLNKTAIQVVERCDVFWACVSCRARSGHESTLDHSDEIGMIEQKIEESLACLYSLEKKH